MLDWLRSEFAVEKPTQKLLALAALGADEFTAEVKKAGKKGFGVAELKRLKDEHAKSVLPLHTLAGEAERLERQVSDVVNTAFGLTHDDVKLMWDTAPPRMPISRPGRSVIATDQTGAIPDANARRRGRLELTRTPALA